MGFKPAKWGKEKVLETIRRYHASGTDLTLSRMSRLDLPLVQAGVRNFGGWRQAVQAAGIDYATVRRMGREHRLRAITKWNRESILQQIRRLWELGEDLRVSAVRMRLPGLYTAARKQYANWNEVLKAADIPFPSASRLAEARRNWKRKWLERLQAQACGLVAGRPEGNRDYRRAFRLRETRETSGWPIRLMSKQER